MFNETVAGGTVAGGTDFCRTVVGGTTGGAAAGTGTGFVNLGNENGGNEVARALHGAVETKMETAMTPTVLLIDDNAIQAATRQTILRRAGYFVIAVLNPRRALDQLQSGEYPGEVGLVITDHTMPEMSGSDFVRELRVTHPALPVMVISGLEEAEQEYDGMNVLFRLKPLLPDNLLANVHTLLKPGTQPNS